MPIDHRTTFEVSTHGDIGADVIERAQERLGRVGRHCREAVTHVELRITDDQSHPDQAHARAEATLVVKHGPVRAHAQAGSISEAVDGMIDRLRRRIDRHESKLHRIGTKKHNGVAAEGLWRHGDVASAPRTGAPVLNELAQVVRRKTFATTPMTVEEAVFDIDILDHDFYLFEDAGTASTCLLIAKPHGGFDLAVDGEGSPEMPDDVPINEIDGPIVLDLESGTRLMATTAEPFVFHRPSADAAAQVTYRRYDGNLGVIELAPR